jgi:hypothetical protein
MKREAGHREAPEALRMGWRLAKHAPGFSRAVATTLRLMVFRPVAGGATPGPSA